jgi:hypothetical protein
LHYSLIYLILQTTRHSTHTHASSTIHLLGKHACGHMSFWANVFLGQSLLGKCLSGQMSFWANVFWFWANNVWANVFWGVCLLGKCLMGKCPSGQIYFWANVFWAHVFWANVVLGKCLWANVSRQMSLGKCRMVKCRVTVGHDVPSFSLLVGSITFTVPSPVPTPIPVSRSRPFSRFLCVSRLLNPNF